MSKFNWRLVRGIGAGIMIGSLVSVSWVAALGATLFWLGVVQTDEYYKRGNKK